jgi:hypothetical protein
LTDKPRFTLRMYLSQTGSEIAVPHPTFFTAEQIADAWNMMNVFMMDTLDESQLDVDDETFREMFIELCYYLILREMRTLFSMPRGEKAAMDAIKEGKRYYGPRLPKGEWH